MSLIMLLILVNCMIYGVATGFSNLKCTSTYLKIDDFEVIIPPHENIITKMCEFNVC